VSVDISCGLNKKLSADMLVYGYGAFTLIFVEVYEVDSITSKLLHNGCPSILHTTETERVQFL